MSTDNWKVLLKLDMDELETLNRLEPNITAKDGESEALLSIAISAKRIADRLDRRTPEERVREAHRDMVNGLPRRNHIARDLSFTEIMKLVGDYFRKLTGIQSDELV